MSTNLGELLDNEELGLRLVTGDAAARARQVRGAHPIEITAPTRWVPEGWVMLTNGLRLRGRPDEQRKLVAELASGGVAALGWAVGTVMQRIPRALLDEAERRSFPVFLVPLETAFRQIVAFLGQAREHDDVYLMQRVAAMEDYLLDSLAAERPEQATVRRLASALDADVLLTLADGTPVEASGALPDPATRTAIAARETSAAVHPVRLPGGGERLLVITGDPPIGLARPLVHRAVQLLELLTRRDDRLVESTREQGARLLDRCIDPQEDDLPGLDAEAGALGVHVSAGAYATVWSGASAADVRSFLGDTPHLLTARADLPVALVCGSTPPASAGVTVGVGAEIDTLRDFTTSLTGAHLALLAGRTTGPVVTEADLDPLARALVRMDDAGRAEIRAILDPLRDKPHLVETVTCWLDTDCDVNAAAARLHVHRNTLRYRLTRVERLTGLTLAAPRTAANLSLALLADGLSRLT